MPQYLSRKGLQLWYEELGQGPAVVLLHGWCMSSAVWRQQLTQLSQEFRVIAPDLAGHGRSAGFAEHCTMEGFTEDLVDLFQQLDLQDVCLAGWSLGSMIAMASLPWLQARVTSLVLVASTPCFTTSENFSHALAAWEVEGMAVKVARNAGRALQGFRSRMFAPGELESSGWGTQLQELLAGIPIPDTAVILHSLRTLAEVDLRPLLPGITVPTLVVSGDQDPICLPEASSFLASRIAGSRRLILDGCGHAPFLTRPDLFNAGLAPFCRTRGARHE